MKKKPGSKGEKLSEKVPEGHDDVNEFIQRKKIQNKVLKEIIDQLRSTPDEGIKK